MKKIQKLILGVLLLAFVFACNKDEAPKPVDPDPMGQPDPEPEPDNRAPGSFGLIEPKQAESNSILKPTLVWEQATDPDGDGVVYDLYLDANTTPDSLLAEGLNSTSIELEQNLQFDLEYYWKVIARDVHGAEKASEVFSFTTRKLPLLASFTEIFGGGEPKKRQLNYDDNGRVTIIEYYDHVNSVFYDSSDHVSSVVPDRYPATNYTYNHNGQLKSLDELRSRRTWLFFRDDQGKLSEIRLNRVSDPVITYNLIYDDQPNLPSEIWRDDTLLKQYVWDSNGNPIKVMDYDSEGNLKSSSTQVFDDKNNPWYPIIAKKLGFEELFFIGQTFGQTAGFEFVDNPLLRISRNNQVRYSGFNEDFTFSGEIIYEYNNEGFPIESTLMSIIRESPDRHIKTIYAYRE